MPYTHEDSTYRPCISGSFFHEKEISEAIFCMRMRDRQRFHNVEKNNKSIYNLPDFAIKWCIKQIYFVKILFNKHIDDF